MYEPQTGLPETEKEHFYDPLQYTVAKVPAIEILIPVGDMRSHIGAPASVFSSGGHSTQIDYKLNCKSFSSTVSNVKVKSVKQHHMMVCDFTPHIPHLKKRKFTPHTQNWKLMDPATASQFQSAFRVKIWAAAAAVDNDFCTDVDTSSRIESSWSKLKGPLLDAATEVWGLYKNHLWKPEAWWWNEEVDKAIKEKHARFEVYSALRKWGMTAEAKEAKSADIDAKSLAKHAVWLAKSEWRKRNLPQYPQMRWRKALMK